MVNDGCLMVGRALGWLVTTAIGPEPSDDCVLNAQRSVTTSIGQSDLDLAVSLFDGSVHYLLIENKVSAGMQPRQAERYRERGEVYVAEGECAGFTTVHTVTRGAPPAPRT